MKTLWNRNRLTRKLGIEYPIIQGPLGGLSSQRLTATVSNFGGLGSFGAHGLAPHAIDEVVAEIRSLTSKPFAMNLWVSMDDEGARASDIAAFRRSLAPLAGHLEALGVALPVHREYSPLRFEDQVRVLLEARVPVFSFIFRHSARRDSRRMPRKIDRYHRHRHNCRGSRSPRCCRRGRDCSLGLRSRRTPRFISPLPRRFHDGHNLARPSSGGCGGHSRDCSRRDRRRTGRRRGDGPGRRGRSDGHCLPYLRGIRRATLHRQALLAKETAHTALTKGFTGRLARGLRKRLMDELNQPRDRDSAISSAARAGPESGDRGRGSRTSRTGAHVGWTKRAGLSGCTEVSTFLTSLIREVSQTAGQVAQWTKRRNSNSRENMNPKEPVCQQ